MSGRGGERRGGRKGVWRMRRREGLREGITKAGREGWVRREGGRKVVREGEVGTERRMKGDTKGGSDGGHYKDREGGMG